MMLEQHSPRNCGGLQTAEEFSRTKLPTLACRFLRAPRRQQQRTQPGQIEAPLFRSSELIDSLVSSWFRCGSFQPPKRRISHQFEIEATTSRLTVAVFLASSIFLIAFTVPSEAIGL